MKLYMQVLIALGLGLKRNWHIFAGLVLGVFAGIWLHKDPNPVIMTTFTFILVVMLIAGIMIVFSKDRGCIGLIIGVILIVFSTGSLIGSFDKADKEFVEDVQLGQYQMNVQEAMEDNNKTGNNNNNQ